MGFGVEMVREPAASLKDCFTTGSEKASQDLTVADCLLYFKTRPQCVQSKIPKNLFSCTNRPYIASFSLIGSVHDAVIAHVHDPRIGYTALEGITRPVAVLLHAAKEARVARWKGRIVVA